MPRRMTLFPAPLLLPAFLLATLTFACSQSRDSDSMLAGTQYEGLPGSVQNVTSQNLNPQSINPQSQQVQSMGLQATNSQAAYSQARIVRLSYVDGNVRFDRSDGGGSIQAFINMPVIEGARLSTEADGRAEVQFEDGSTIRLMPGTTLDIQQLRLSANGERISSVAVTRGQAYFDVKKRSADQFAVSFPQRQLVVKKPSHFRVAVDSDGLKVADFKGNLELSDPDGHNVDIGKNESLSLDFSDPGRYFLAHGTTLDPQDSWDHAREEQLAVADSKQNQNLAYASAYSTAYSYSYGLSDLSRYGSYIYAPGYGYMWRPYYASAYWDPFQDGSWYWYPGYNYIFVSSHPWGWTPYHYGTWVNVPRLGWCWNPNGNPNFVPLAGIINAPPGFRIIRPPRVPPPGNVIPVGRGVAAAGTLPSSTGAGLAGREPRGGVISGQVEAQSSLSQNVGSKGLGIPIATIPAILPAMPIEAVGPALKVVQNPLSDGQGDASRFVRGTRDATTQSAMPVRPIQAPAAMTATRRDRGSRLDVPRAMPARGPSMPPTRPMSSPSHTSSPGVGGFSGRSAAPAPSGGGGRSSRGK